MDMSTFCFFEIERIVNPAHVDRKCWLGAFWVKGGVND